MEGKFTLKDLIEDRWCVEKFQGVSGMFGQEIRRSLHSMSVVNYRLREAIPNMLLRFGWLLIAVVLSLVVLILAVQEAKAQEVFRRIPIRAIALVDDACTSHATPLCGTSCDGSSGIADETKVIQSIEIANKIYDVANIQFYLRSFKRVQAPFLWCNYVPETQWITVKNTIREAFPEVPIDAWPDNEVKGCMEPGAAFRTSWWHAITATYAPKDEISIIIRNCNNSCGDFPRG